MSYGQQKLEMSSSAAASNSAGEYLPSSTAPPTAYVVAPPPAGYPTRDYSNDPSVHVPVETKSRGDGFLKGCCAAICCCCVLDACF